MTNQTQGEIKSFNAEVGKVLHLMIHALYTNKDIFIRELISNASDACDKLRYLSQSQPDLLTNDPEFKITIELNSEQRILRIRDNGIGMDREELINNLGTIAHSGTQQFLSQLTGDAKKDSLLIGQFGVGFYSSYMAADNVEVITRKAGTEECWHWESNGQEQYTISSINYDLKRGTEIILHIRKGEDNYLDHTNIERIVKIYSDHISIPIYLINNNEAKTQLNSSSALWTRPKTDISEQLYNDFYHTISYSADKPWLTLHNKNEGTVEFTNLLFIPEQKTFDLYQPNRKCRVKLYIKRVFITEEGVDLIPHYLRFIRGVVDADDLPLNISRETLQHNPIITKIKQVITKKVISELKKKKTEAFDEYMKFWQNFGSVLKEGLCEEIGNQNDLLEICIFHSAKHSKLISLDDYISSMQPNQKTIYYLTGSDLNKIKHSPQIEGLLSREIDVLLLTDTVDDFWVSMINKYKEYDLKSATRHDIDVDQINKETVKEKDIKGEGSYTSLINYFKETLGDLVKDIKISKKLTTSPVCLSVGQGSMDIRIERLLVEQKQLTEASAKSLEINPKHKIIQRLNDHIINNTVNSGHRDLIRTLFDEACLLEGEPINNPFEFCERLNKLIASNAEYLL